MYKESETLELKSSLAEWRDVIVTLGAFANKSGGKVIVGLDDSGGPLNMVVGKGAIEDLINKVKLHTDPGLFFTGHKRGYY
ncbi:MAG: ATP-binding protein [Pseudomonadota bacterium]